MKINRLVMLLIAASVSGCSSLGSAPATLVSPLVIDTDNCLESPYQADAENTAYETVLPVSKARAKELYTDSATPLGFRFDKRIDDETTTIVRSTDRAFKLDKGLEGHLYARFDKVEQGTRIYLDAESLEMVGKSRDHSYAGSIIKHMICLHSLLKTDAGRSTQNISNTQQIKIPVGQKVELLNYRLLSSRTAQQGEEIQFIVKEDIVAGGEIVIARGAVALGSILEAKPAGAFGVKGKLVVMLEKVQALSGQWFPLVFSNGKNTLDVASDRDLFSGFAPLVVYALAQGEQPSMPSGITVVGQVSSGG